MQTLYFHLIDPTTGYHKLIETKKEYPYENIKMGDIPETIKSFETHYGDDFWKTNGFVYDGFSSDNVIVGGVYTGKEIHIQSRAMRMFSEHRCVDIYLKELFDSVTARLDTFEYLLHCVSVSEQTTKTKERMKHLFTDLSLVPMYVWCIRCQTTGAFAVPECVSLDGRDFFVPWEHYATEYVEYSRKGEIDTVTIKSDKHNHKHGKLIKRVERDDIAGWVMVDGTEPLWGRSEREGGTFYPLTCTPLITAIGGLGIEGGISDDFALQAGISFTFDSSAEQMALAQDINLVLVTKSGQTEIIEDDVVILDDSTYLIYEWETKDD